MLLEKDLTTLSYEEGLELKIKALKSLLKLSYIKSYKSAYEGYRNRAEFAIYRENNELFYAMFKDKKKYIIKSFPIVDFKIQAFMPRLLKLINQNDFLKERLFGVEFLSTKKELSTSLLYHKNIEQYKDEFEAFAKKEGLNLGLRSRKKKLVFGKYDLEQNIAFKDIELRYFYNNDCFIQPNTAINEAMMGYLYELLSSLECEDLLELFCGYGNFTLALARLFKRVLATEISKENIRLAKINQKINKIKNISFARLSTAELIAALNKKREFKRLTGICLDYNFSHVLVDPPRCGLGEENCEFLKKYKNIIYISCNPLSFEKDLQKLGKSHILEQIACFDQFALTPHIEIIAYLKQK